MGEWIIDEANLRSRNAAMAVTGDCLAMRELEAAVAHVTVFGECALLADRLTLSLKLSLGGRMP